MEILNRVEERNHDEGEDNFDGDEDFEVGEEAAPLEKNVGIAQAHGDTLELHILPHQTSIGVEGLVSDV